MAGPTTAAITIRGLGISVLVAGASAVGTIHGIGDHPGHGTGDRLGLGVRHGVLVPVGVLALARHGDPVPVGGLAPALAGLMPHGAPTVIVRSVQQQAGLATAL